MFGSRNRAAARAVLWAAFALFALWCAPGAAVDAAPDERAQQIYLDPDTGEIVSPERATVEPPSERRIGRPDAEASSSSVDEQVGTGSGPRAWESDGVQMLTPDPTDAPMLRAVHCADGSLRIGHAEATAGRSEDEALCASDRD